MRHLKIYEQDNYDPFGEEKVDKVLRIIITEDGRRVFLSEAKTDQEAIDEMKKKTGCGEREYGKLKIGKITETEALQLKRNLRGRRNELERELERINYELQSLFIPENNFGGLRNHGIMM